MVGSHHADCDVRSIGPADQEKWRSIGIAVGESEFRPDTERILEDDPAGRWHDVFSTCLRLAAARQSVSEPRRKFFSDIVWTRLQPRHDKSTGNPVRTARGVARTPRGGAGSIAHAGPGPIPRSSRVHDESAQGMAHQDWRLRHRLRDPRIVVGDLRDSEVIQLRRRVFAQLASSDPYMARPEPQSGIPVLELGPEFVPLAGVSQAP